ncbi:energy transducer TonB [Colwellia sp. UCD-KL20]|uniref:energy transducer TonB n=1 Tax=Colwellia sp. UCD-KL20 TaxID=1917165 RepID=UPI000970B463|nr:energy transducer TonB [Colwellia sp. UCD-KL20]
MRKLFIVIAFLLISSASLATKDPNLLVVIDPIYPVEAYERKVEGWVLLEFNISKLGVPNKILAVDSFPKNIFESAAINAVKQWKYDPMFYAKPRDIVGFQVKLEFKLDKTNKNSG